MTSSRDGIEQATSGISQSTSIVMNTLQRSKPDKTSSSTTPVHSLIHLDTKIDAEKVALNRTNKLYGTFGETIVIFHNSQSLLGTAIRQFQKNIRTLLGFATPDASKSAFVDESDMPAKPTAFAPIINPHTTIIAMRVIDASDSKSWKDNLVESFLYAKFSQYHATEKEIPEIEAAKQKIIGQRDLNTLLKNIDMTLIRKVLCIPDAITDIRGFIEDVASSTPLDLSKEKDIVKMIETNPYFTLEFDAIALSPNGSLSIKWKINHDIQLLRRELSELGGIPKHGADIITTTLGYFPYCTEELKEKISPAIEKALPDFISVLSSTTTSKQSDTLSLPITFKIDVNKAQLVKFARNDLHPEFIMTTDLFAGEQLCEEYHISTFPSSLQHRNASSGKMASPLTTYDPRLSTSFAEIKISNQTDYLPSSYIHQI